MIRSMTAEQRARDLETELADTRRELAGIRHKLEHLLAHSPAVIYALAFSGEVIAPSMVSENIIELLGCTIAEAMDAAWWIEQIHPDDRNRVLAEVPMLLERGSIRREYRIRHKDGTHRWV